MSEGRPRLVALPEPTGLPRPPEASRSRRAIGWLLALALLCASGFGLAQLRSARLARELAATQNELSEARTRLAALEAQRNEVHTQLEALSSEASALAGRIAELEALVAGDRAGATDAQLPRSEPRAAE